MCINCHKETKRVADVEECPECGRSHTNVAVRGTDENYDSDGEWFYCPATVEHLRAKAVALP